MTPLEARDPYTAVAEASFRMVIVSMSLGFSQEIWLPMMFSMSSIVPIWALNSMGSSWMIPSTTKSGSVLPKVEVPRILMLGEEPARELVRVTTMPGTCPCNMSVMLL